MKIIRELIDNQVFINNNEILKRELPILLDDLTVELEQLINSVYENDSESRVLFFDGYTVQNATIGSEEQVVNDCCLRIYTATANC